MNKLVLLLFISTGFANAEITVDNFSDRSVEPTVHSNNKSLTVTKAVGGACWNKAESAYGVPAKLLYAIAKVETNLQPNKVGLNKDGSMDIGLMQINNRWLPTLRKFNISQQDLFDHCTNVMVGAWILADNIQRLGYNWNAVGAYNAKTIWKRDIYAKKVHKAIIELGYNR